MTSHFSLTGQQALAGTESKPTTVAFKIMLVLLFVANVYDPGGAFGVKYGVFLIACVFSLWTLKYVDLSAGEIVAGLFLFAVWPIWSFIYGILRGGDPSVGLTQVTPFLFALVLALILPAFDSRLPLRLFYACVFSLSIVVVISFVLVFLLPGNPLSMKLLEAFVSLHGQEGFFGTRPMGDADVPVLYFRSTLFLVPTCVYYLFVGRMVRAGAAFLALAITWSKAGIFIALAFGVVYSVTGLFSRAASRPIDRTRIRWPGYSRALSPVLLLAGIASLVLLSFPQFAEYIRDTVAGESDTALLRIAHYHSIIALLSDNPHYLLVGQGTGIPFFTSGRSDYVHSIELDHLDTIRKFGFPWFLGFSYVVFFSAWRLIKARHVETRAIGLALISMYLAAGTNPVLLTPLFIMLMTLSYFAQRSAHGRPS